MTDLTLLETDRLVLSGWRPDQIDDLYRLHRLLDGRRTPSPARPCAHACKRLGESQKRSDTLRKKCIARSIGRARIEMENRAERTPRRKEKHALKA